MERQLKTKNPKSDMADNIVPIRQTLAQRQIVALIKKFDLPGIPQNFLRDFDAKQFDEWAFSTDLSRGERIIATFILGVWNRYDEWKIGPFDFFTAAAKLGYKEWGVIIKWCQEPFFP